MRQIIYLFIITLLICKPSLGGGIEGKVVNGSLAGEPVRNAQLLLHQVDGDILEKIKTDHKGRFKLGGEIGAPEGTFHLLIRHEGVEYLSDVFQLTESKVLEITVYDTTHSDDSIAVEAHHLIVEVASGELVVTEIIILQNHGEKTFAGEVEVPLPKGALNPEFVEGIREVEEDGRYYDMQGVKPGSKEMVFRYGLKMPRASRKANLRVPLHYQTSLLSFLISDPQLDVKSSQLSPAEIQRIGDREYLSLVGRDLPKGSVVEVEVGGLPRVWSSFEKTLVGGLFLLVVAGVGITVMKKVRERTPKDSASRPEESLPRDELLERKGYYVSALADLEERFQRGRLSKGFYEETKSFHRKQLKRVLEALEERTNSK